VQCILNSPDQGGVPHCWRRPYDQRIIKKKLYIKKRETVKEEQNNNKKTKE
jgi:hypothetical protein